MRRTLTTLRRIGQRHQLRELLLLCLPAALLAIALRFYLIWHYPVAFIHNDSASLIETAHTLLTKAAFATEGKKTLLVPAIYCIPALLGIPILAFAAALQHLLGVALVFLVGLLARAWLSNWRLFIFPLTCLIAIHPVLLWYEHVALAETYAVFTAVLFPLVGWLFSRLPRPATLAGFLGALALVATARPEGNLFAFFAISLVAWVYWGKWRQFALATGATCVWAALLFVITQTSQGGTLLYASVVHLTPDRLVLSPGISEAVRSVRADSQAEWAGRSIPGLVGIRKSLQDAVETELAAQGTDPREARSQVNSVCKVAAAETILRAPLAIPAFVLRKFVIGHHEPPVLGFNDYAIAGQASALVDDGESQKALRFTNLAWAEDFTSHREAETYFTETTTPVPGDWLWGYLLGFQRTILTPVLPFSLPGADTEGVDFKGLPWLYSLAVLGLIALAARPPRPVNFHVLFGLFLVGFFIVVILTANVRARFRLGFEPFWFIYAAAFLDSIWSTLRAKMALTTPQL